MNEYSFDWIDPEVIRATAEVADGIGSYWLGKVTSLIPSGKYYMPWVCGHVTEEEIEADSEWWAALEDYLSKFDMWAENGEGDPLDLFICFHVESEDEAEVVL